jgi:hypothetical protein
MLKNLSVVGVVLVLSASAAIAQPRSTAGSCAADIRSQCAGVKPGRGRIRACVKEHFKDLSDKCRARLAEFAAARQACTADVKKNCADVKPGRGQIAACIRPLIVNVSDSCKEALAGAVAGRR